MHRPWSQRAWRMRVRAWKLFRDIIISAELNNECISVREKIKKELIESNVQIFQIFDRETPLKCKENLE